MSRLGKQPIIVPKGVQVTHAGKTVTVKGSKGSLTLDISEQILLDIKEGEVELSLKEGYEGSGNIFGLYRQLIRNMVIGVSAGFQKNLEMIGVGYRAAVQGKVLDLQIGYSHPTRLNIPQGIEVKIEKNTAISITGLDKQQVGQFAANVRELRPPEPYKGKGIRYVGEFVRRKAGKSGKNKAA